MIPPLIEHDQEESGQSYEQLWDDIKGFIASELEKFSDLVENFGERLENVEASVRLLENKITESTSSSSDGTPQSTQKRKRKSDLKLQVNV